MREDGGGVEEGMAGTEGGNAGEAERGAGDGGDSRRGEGGLSIVDELQEVVASWE